MVDKRIDELPALVGTPAIDDVVAGWDLSGLVTVKISGQQLIDLQPTVTTSVRGFMSAADKTKLDGVATGATANQTDSFLLARANHTGTQVASTISDFDEAAQDAVGNILVDSSTVDFTYSDATPSITAGVITDSSVQRVDVLTNGTSVGSRRAINLINGTNVTITGVDNSGSNRVDVTVNATGVGGYTNEEAQDAVGTILLDSASIDFTYDDVTPNITAVVIADTTTQRVEILKGGSAIGTRKAINLIEGTNVTMTVADNSGSNRVDVTINSSGGGLTLDGFRTQPIWACEFLNLGTTTAQFDPFLGAAIGGGTVANANASIITRHHPGVIRARSSTTANSGYTVTTGGLGQILIGGNEVFECVVNITTLTNGTFRIGFIDTNTSADCVDGAYFEIPAAGTVVAKTSNNSTRTTSATLFTATVATWYRFRVTVNSNATSINFNVFNDSGVSQGSTDITTNIPTAAGRETGCGVIGTNSGTTATDLYHLDFMALSYAGTLTR